MRLTTPDRYRRRGIPHGTHCPAHRASSQKPGAGTTSSQPLARLAYKTQFGSSTSNSRAKSGNSAGLSPNQVAPKPLIRFKTHHLKLANCGHLPTCLRLPRLCCGTTFPCFGLCSSAIGSAYGTCACSRPGLIRCWYVPCSSNPHHRQRDQPEVSIAGLSLGCPDLRGGVTDPRWGTSSTNMRTNHV